MTAEPPLKILLVEDSEEDVFFFRRALLKTGINAELKVASDGEEALNIMEEEGSSFEAIFLDLKLPKRTGFEVLAWAQGQNFHPPLPIVVLSGSDHDRDKLLATRLGVSKYLVKPVRTEVLRQHLSALVPALPG